MRGSATWHPTCHHGQAPTRTPVGMLSPHPMVLQSRTPSPLTSLTKSLKSPSSIAPRPISITDRQRRNPENRRHFQGAILQSKWQLREQIPRKATTSSIPRGMATTACPLTLHAGTGSVAPRHGQSCSCH